MNKIRPALCALAVCAASSACAQAIQPVNDDDRAQFQSLYSQKLEAVHRTRETVDDRALVKEMLELARTIPDSPGVRCLIYIEAIPLAAESGDLDAAVRAADLLEALWPGHEAADPDSLLEAAGRAYRDASREDRPAVAEPYLNLLLNAAEQAEQVNNLDQAIALCRQANTVARAVDSDRSDYIVDTLNRLSHQSAVVLKIETLAASVRKNPKNTPAAKELVELLVIDRDDPVAAAEFAGLTGDEDLAEVVAMCAEGVEHAGAPAALCVGDWYLAMADREKDDLAEPLLRRAMRWYARFLEVYPREDALSKRVESMSLVARGRADRIAEAKRAAMRGKWIDLIGTAFDARLHTLSGSVKLRRGEIQLKEGAFVLPVTPQGDFELRVRMTMDPKSPGLVVHLPVAREGATFYYSVLDNTLSSIQGLEEMDFNKELMNLKGQQVELVFQAAKQDDGELALAMLVNGTEALRWQGAAKKVQPNEKFSPPPDMGPILRLSSDGTATFHAIELREIAR